jgi:hypothetical protein
MKNLPENDSDLLTLALTQIESGQETMDSFLAQIPDRAQELQPELEAALWLRSHKPSLEARPGFLAASRANLVDTLRTQQPPQKQPGIFRRTLSQPAPRNPLLEVLSLITLIICVAFVTHNVVLMSELSLPGEPFYPVKLSLEQSRLAFTFDPEENTHMQSQMAQRRTAEIIELLLDKNYQSVPSAADRLDRQLQASLAALDSIEKTDPAKSQVIRLAYQETLSTESMILTILLDTYPSDASQYIEMALQITNNGLAELQD